MIRLKDELLKGLCYGLYNSDANLQDYVENCSQLDENVERIYPYCDYVVTDGDGLCDDISGGKLQFLATTNDLDCDDCPDDDTDICPLECINENYSAADCESTDGGDGGSDGGDGGSDGGDGWMVMEDEMEVMMVVMMVVMMEDQMEVMEIYLLS